MITVAIIFFLFALVAFVGVGLYHGTAIGLPALRDFGQLTKVETARPLSPTKLQKRIVKIATKAALFVSVTGERRVIPSVVVDVSPGDYGLLAGMPQSVDRTAKDISILVERNLKRERAVFTNSVSVSIKASDAVDDGRPRARHKNELHTKRLSPSKLLGSNEATKQLDEKGTTKALVRPARLSDSGPGGPEFGLGAGGRSDYTIGRSGDLQVDVPSVSARHASISFDGQQWHIEDLDSTNGLYINDDRVKKAMLSQGDRVQLGPNGPTLTFVWRGP